jgi:nitrate reductase (NAD(P)H)
MLADYYIGDLVDSPPSSVSVSSVPSATSSPDVTEHNSHKASQVTGAAVVAAAAAKVASQAAAAATADAAGDAVLVALNPRAKVALKLQERIMVSHNTRIFRFALPTPQHKLGLPCGRHLMVYASVKVGRGSSLLSSHILWTSSSIGYWC